MSMNVHHLFKIVKSRKTEETSIALSAEKLVQILVQEMGGIMAGYVVDDGK